MSGLTCKFYNFAGAAKVRNPPDMSYAARANVMNPTCMFSLGGRVTRHGSALGWDRPSGWSRRSLQGPDLRAALPQIRFEPSLPDAARFMSGGFCDLASSDWTVGERHSPFMASPAKTKTPTVIVAIT